MTHSVEWRKPEYEEWLPKAELVEDVCENKVKCKGKLYLPMPNPEDNSDKNVKRYKQYLERAQMYGFTRHTLAGLVGKAFQEDPDMTIPEGLSYVEQDIDGEGNGIIQQSQRCLRGILVKGRHCLLVDYPNVDFVPTRREQEELFIRPTVLSIDATRVINWRTEKFGATSKLSLVVYQDDAIEFGDDGFSEVVVPQYRVLKLISGEYVVEMWRVVGDGMTESWEIVSSWVPKDANGNSLTEIPMVFIGSTNNDTEIDEIPLYDIASLNIGHYRNSADYEKNSFVISNPQPWASGIDEAWLADRGDVTIGPDFLLPIPEGQKFEIAQVKPNMVAKEGMEHKKVEMMALGATLIQPTLPVRTATQAAQEHQTQHSILSLGVSNVSDGYERCLEWMKLYSGVDGDTSFEINTNFILELTEPLATAKINRDSNEDNTISDSE